ncbi:MULTISPECIES: hypothetical protein [unclassified Hyphomonas]|nr:MULTISPECIES: hypothetical protein [unclassified Hyphomonas]RAN40639.1 hypothetical protein HY26_12030 [Hyphomonas sp. GM-8P]
MAGTTEEKQFNETLKRMMKKKPKPHEEMKKKGRGPKPAPKGDRHEKR